MKLQILSLAGALSLALFATAAESEDGPIKVAMKKFHKAPQGVDTVAKKVTLGAASKQEIKELVAAYRKMVDAKPPRGEAASWKEKSGKILAAAIAVERGEADAVSRYKEASNCKACHSAHKPE